MYVQHLNVQHLNVQHLNEPGVPLNHVFLPRPLPEGKGRGQHAVFRLQVRVLVEMPKNMSCDWSMRFMRWEGKGGFSVPKIKQVF